MRATAAIRWAFASAFTGAAVLAATGCANFEDESRIVDLRILGIMADPPEIYFDPQTVGADPDPLTSAVTALVVDPRGNGRAVSYSALACPRELDTVTAATGRNGVVCAHNVPGMTPSSLEIIPPDMPAATTDPGPEHDIPLAVSVSGQLVEAALGLDPFGAQGFQMPLVVQLELAAGAESIVATKRVIFSQQLVDRPPQAANQNPTLTSVLVYPTRDAQANPVDAMDLPDGTPISLPLGAQLWFEPVGAVAEPYSTRSLTRDTPPQIVTLDVPAESLRYAFFTNAGAFSPAETTSIRSVVRDDHGRVHVESLYTAPGVMPDDPNVTIWIVVHDERGGASWSRRQLTLEP
jgi:hypothetical protein